MNSAGTLLVLFVLLCGYHDQRVCALQCYCHFDPGETDYVKTCSGKPSTCNSTVPQPACFYHRQERSISGGTTVTVEYGCYPASDECIGFERAATLTYCCYSDLCNRNYSRLLASERVDNTMPPTTPAPNNSVVTTSPYLWAAVGVTVLAIVLFAVFAVSAILVAVHICNIQRRRTTPRSDQEEHESLPAYDNEAAS